MFFPRLFLERDYVGQRQTTAHTGNPFFLLIILIYFFEVVITGTCYLFAAMRL